MILHGSTCDKCLPVMYPRMTLEEIKGLILRGCKQGFGYRICNVSIFLLLSNWSSTFHVVKLGRFYCAASKPVDVVQR